MTNTNRRKVITGDLLEVQTPHGLSYVQYVGKHPEYGDVIRVLPGSYEHRMSDFTALIEKPGYVAFYSARASVAQGLTEIVGSYPLQIEVPRNVRRAGARARTGRILTWIVESNGQEMVRKELTETEKQLPIAAIWDHELLILRISEHWSPQQEG